MGLTRLFQFAGTCLLAMTLPVHAAWTGISAFVGQHDTDWQLSDRTLQADIFSYGLRIEERSRPGLRVGLGIGQFDLRLKDRDNAVLVNEYGGELLLFYLRWPFTLGQNWTLHTRFDYQYHSGRESKVNEPRDDIDWTETSLAAGIALDLDAVSLQPFMHYSRTDGDLVDDNQTRLVDQADSVSFGMRVDILVEPTAYVRIEASGGAADGVIVYFAREY